jgi:hypothetical protein
MGLRLEKGCLRRKLNLEMRVKTTGERWMGRRTGVIGREDGLNNGLCTGVIGHGLCIICSLAFSLPPSDKSELIPTQQQKGPSFTT